MYSVSSQVLQVKWVILPLITFQFADAYCVSKQSKDRKHAHVSIVTGANGSDVMLPPLFELPGTLKFIGLIISEVRRNQNPPTSPNTPQPTSPPQKDAIIIPQKIKIKNIDLLSL